MAKDDDERAALLWRLGTAIARHRDYDVTDGPYLGGFRGAEVLRKLASGELMVIHRNRVVELCEILENAPTSP